MMTVERFVAGLRKMRAPTIMDARATGMPGVFLITFDRPMTDPERERLRRVGFSFVEHAQRPNRYMMKWRKPIA